MNIDEEGRPICDVCKGIHPGWTQEEASSDNSVYQPCLQASACEYCSCGLDESQAVPCKKFFVQTLELGHKRHVMCSICYTVPMGELGKSSTRVVTEVAHAQLEAAHQMLADMRVDILRALA